MTAQVTAPSLDGCLAKLEHAAQHVGLAKASIERATPPLTAEVEVELASGRAARTLMATLKVARVPDVPEQLSLYVGDAIHNVRSALDYLARELVALEAGGAYYDWTQFPIATSPRAHSDRDKDTIARLGAHWEIIEKCQPYGDPTDVWSSAFRILQIASNTDKHRHRVQPVTTVDVSALPPMYLGHGVARTEPVRLYPGVLTPGRVIATETLLLLDDDPEQPVHHLGTYLPSVSFEDWPTLSVADVLQLIHRKAEMLVQRFVPLFGAP